MITFICIRNIQASERLSQSKPPVLSTRAYRGSALSLDMDFRRMPQLSAEGGPEEKWT